MDINTQKAYERVSTKYATYSYEMNMNGYQYIKVYEWVSIHKSMKGLCKGFKTAESGSEYKNE